MHDSNSSLPADRAFVIQLLESRSEPGIRHAGRIEHLSSGRAERFGSEDELWAFVDGTLAEEEER